MKTISEKQATTGQLIDDIASTATGHSSGNWEDADTTITNDQTDDEWRNNARVLHHSPSGQYLLLYIDQGYAEIGYNDYTAYKGVRIVVSNDWDTEQNAPAGYTNIKSGDDMRGDVGNEIQDSFAYTNHDGDDTFSDASRAGIWYYGDRSGSKSDKAADDVTYFASVGANYLNVGAWNTTDGDDGCAGYAAWEHVDNKFWADGNDPWAMYTTTNTGQASRSDNNDFSHGMYGWQYWRMQNSRTTDHPYTYLTGAERGQWGIINPDANDDTFFFQRPVLYQTNEMNVPVAYIEDVISNDTQEGGAHGDVITHDGVDYRCFRQSGAAGSYTISAGLRYE